MIVFYFQLIYWSCCENTFCLQYVSLVCIFFLILCSFISSWESCFYWVDVFIIVFHGVKHLWECSLLWVIFFCGLSSILLIHIPVPIDACVYMCVCVCVHTTFNLFPRIFRVMDFSVDMLHFFFFCLFASSLPSLSSCIVLLMVCRSVLWVYGHCSTALVLTPAPYLKGW